MSTDLRRGYSLLQAVNLSPPPWRSTDLWKYADKLLASGFILEEKIRPGSQPLLNSTFQIVFPSIIDCANYFNSDYTTLCENFKKMDLDEYLDKKNRVPKIGQGLAKTLIN